MWILGGQGVAGLFPQGLVHPVDELAVRSLGCNGPDGFKIKDFHVFSLSIFIFLLSYKPPGFRRRASGFIDRALRRRGCGHPPSADAAFPGRLQSWPAPPQQVRQEQPRWACPSSCPCPAASWPGVTAHPSQDTRPDMRRYYSRVFWKFQWFCSRSARSKCRTAIHVGQVNKISELIDKYFAFLYNSVGNRCKSST